MHKKKKYIYSQTFMYIIGIQINLHLQAAKLSEVVMPIQYEMKNLKNHWTYLSHTGCRLYCKLHKKENYPDILKEIDQASRKQMFAINCNLLAKMFWQLAT